VHDAALAGHHDHVAFDEHVAQLVSTECAVLVAAGLLADDAVM
jgi:hypothetical protein